MPKKKLTKAQVKRKFKTILTSMRSMFVDKLDYPSSSYVTLSMKKIIEDSASYARAKDRVK